MSELDKLIAQELLADTEVAALQRQNRQLAAELERVREMLSFTQSSIEFASTAIFWIDPSGKFMFVNDHACKSLGYTRAQLLASYVFDIDPAYQKEHWPEFWNYLKQAGYLTFESRHKTSIGREHPVEITANYLKYSGNEYVFAFAVDITERKQAEIEFRRVYEELKEHTAMKDELVSNISHEIRTPLCVFKNILSNALAGVCGPLNKKLKLNLQIAEQNVDRLSRIVNDFLDVSKMDAGRMPLNLAEVNVQELILEVTRSFSVVANSKLITLSTIMQDSSIMIEADRDKLVQVLSNLIGNALKFTPAHGQISVIANDYADQVTIAVQDTGIGIKPADLEKIFDRFVQVRKLLHSTEHGTGLGLAIIKNLVELHHGRVWAQSEFGRGSTFTFVLPKKQPQSTRP